jgi:hypothetical protein
MTRDVAIVAAVRKLIGPKVKLMIDFNQSQTTASAIERVLRLKEFDLTWVEEPVSADDLRGHRAVRDAVAPVPIQTGENWWFPRGMANAIAAGASDLAMVDIMKIGGITGWISAGGQAEAASLPLSNHTFVEASAHVMAASPTASWFEYLDLAGAVLTEPLVPTRGKVRPQGLGLGIEWDEQAARKYAFEKFPSLPVITLPPEAALGSFQLCRQPRHEVLCQFQKRARPVPHASGAAGRDLNLSIRLRCAADPSTADLIMAARREQRRCCVCVVRQWAGL